MTKFGISQPVRRVEDVRFLKAEGNHIEHLTLPDQARAIVLRPPVADLEEAIENDVDALWDEGIHHVDNPATPLRVWNWLRAAKTAAE